MSWYPAGVSTKSFWPIFLLMSFQMYLCIPVFLVMSLCFADVCASIVCLSRVSKMRDHRRDSTGNRSRPTSHPPSAPCSLPRSLPPTASFTFSTFYPLPYSPLIFLLMTLTPHSSLLHPAPIFMPYLPSSPSPPASLSSQSHDAIPTSSSILTPTALLCSANYTFFHAYLPNSSAALAAAAIKPLKNLYGDHFFPC